MGRLFKIIGVSVFAVLIIFIGYRFLSRPSEDVPIRSVKVELAISNFLMIHGEKDKKEFLLESKKCTYDKKKGIFFLPILKLLTI